ncbi:MAG: TerD family protein [Deltaproteobacteria bacterium]|jgi:tellurium resistance protein TerZ|nr:TerD family protein [Deltaproteobacteria bacterium]
MAINLTKGQRISLDKESGGGLSKVVMGLGWDPVKKKGLFFSRKVDIDLDASCGMFDANKNPVDMVWFSQLKSKDGSIVHTGDNLTGQGEGDDEQIIVDLARVPANVTSLIFTVNSFRGQTFNEVENAYCRIVDTRNNGEIARYTLTGGGAFTAMIMAKLYRHNNEWKMAALGEQGTGRTINELLPAMISTL